MTDPQAFYDLQRLDMDGDGVDDARRRIHRSWFDEGTVDAWRHERMYESASSIASFYRAGPWVTIGDGRYGLDSVRLKKRYALQDVLPTDIASNMLTIGCERGLFDRFSVENAEALSFDDDAFDVVFCKEAYHHFPRPALALYEMVRVCRSVVVLIEPVDYPTMRLSRKDYLRAFPRLLWSLLLRSGRLPPVAGIAPVDHAFEASGNYCYAISIPELTKMMHALDLGDVAWKGLNDCYVAGCEFEPAVPGNPVFEQVRGSIERSDEACRESPGYTKYSLATVAVFKRPVDPGLRESMIRDGFTFVDKIANPVLGRLRDEPAPPSQ